MEFLYQDVFPSTQKAKYASVFLCININSDLTSDPFFFRWHFDECRSWLPVWWLGLVYVPGCHWKESVIPVAPFLACWTVSCEAAWLPGVISPCAGGLLLASWISTSLSHGNCSYSWLLWPEICLRWNVAFGVSLPTPLSTNSRPGPLSLLGRHQFLKARRSLEVESCRLSP